MTRLLTFLRSTPAADATSREQLAKAMPREQGRLLWALCRNKLSYGDSKRWDVIEMLEADAHLDAAAALGDCEGRFSQISFTRTENGGWLCRTSAHDGTECEAGGSTLALALAGASIGSVVSHHRRANS